MVQAIRVDLLESFRLGGRLDRGRRYARAGQVLDLQVAAGLVSARVQGSRVRPYRVRLETPVLAAPDWKRVEQAMAGRAAFAARLLAGEMPHDIEETFAAAGVSLFPASPRNLASSCSCPDWSNPCKHVAAVYYLLAEAFDDDPFLIFAWRGRTRSGLAACARCGAAIPARRGTRDVRGRRAGPGDDGGLVPPLEAPPLTECLDRFWSAGDLDALGSAREQPRSPTHYCASSTASGGRGGRDLAELLAPAYRILTVAAERRALAEDAG